MFKAAVDWGSSSFRAFRFDGSANHIDSVNSSAGIKFVEHRNFEHALRNQIGHWLSPGDSILLSGMITSRNGWKESAYIDCPARVDDLLKQSSRITLPDFQLVFLPGVSQSAPADVMRGEELQILGALQRQESKLFVIPGTHSKWAMVENGEILRFRTIPTGELFDILLCHSLIGTLTNKINENQAAFNIGVEAGFNTATIISDLFTTRSSVLLNQRPIEEAGSWLSGLLIGNEIREGRNLSADNELAIELIGSAQLCEKYRKAFHLLDIEATVAAENVTAEGFKKIIQSGESEQYE